MSLASFILPNLNFDALVGVLIAIVGAIVAYLSKFVFIKDIRKLVAKIGFIMILGGIGYWIAISWLQDILANPKIWMSVVVGIIVLVAGILIFWEK